jgi:TonB family protein
LFASDQETVRQVGGALQQLELDVECCQDIFAALEMLTSRHYDVIVADWDEGAEATFFLDTARNLKSNTAFSVAVIGAVENIATSGFDVDLILRKPALAEQVKYCLLASDRFVVGMRDWMARWDTSAPSRAASLRLVEGAGPSRLESPRTITRQAAPVDRVEAPPPSASLPSAALVHHTGTQEIPAGWETSSEIAEPEARPQTRVERRRLVLAALALAAAIFAAGNGFENRQSSKTSVTLAGVVPESLRQAMRDWTNWRASHGLSQASEEWDETSRGRVANEDRPTRSRIADSKIRVLEVRAASLKPALFVPDPASPDSAVPSPASDLEAEGTPQPSSDQSGAEASAPPESLRRSRWQSPEANRTGEDSLERTRALQPVELTEALAEKLLLKSPPPSYPEQALRARIEGAVVLEAWIGVDGEIRQLKLIRGSLLLGQAACAAVRSWRYKPYLLNGQAVEAETMVTIDFRLP